MTDTETNNPDNASIEYLKDRFADSTEMTAGLNALEQLVTTVNKLTTPNNVEQAAVDDFVDKVHRLVERALLALGDIDPLLATPTLATAFANPTTNLNNTLASAWNNAGPKNSNITNGLVQFTDGVRNLIASAGTAANAALPDIHRQLTDTLATARNRAGLLKKARTVHDEWHTDQVTQVADLVASANRNFGDLQQRGIDNTDAVIEQATRRFEADRKAFVETCAGHDTDAEQLLDRIRKQLGIASDITLSTDYALRANKEDTTANGLRNAAILTGASGVAVALFFIIWTGNQLDNDADYNPWDLAPLKVVLVIALGSIAAYLGRQSERHRNFARRLRVNALELNNIGDYLSELTPTERSDVKRELVTTFFGQHLDPTDDDSPTTGQSADQLLDLLKLALKK